ncbi:hypothetical protein WLU81_23155, partial [Bordetella bronchiseptica]
MEIHLARMFARAAGGQRRGGAAPGAPGGGRSRAGRGGAHAASVDGCAGTRFALWAPNARRVAVV